MPHNITLCDHCGHSLDAQAPSFPLDVNMYLRSGAQISESEANICSNTVVGWRDEIHKYDAEISQMKSTLEKLQGIRQSISDCIQTSEALLAPVRRVPHDVLQDIFEWLCVSVSYNPFPKHDDMTLISTTPFYLSSVCFRWRSICLSSPRLWTSVFASADRDINSPHFKNVSALCEERSGSLPSNLQVSAAGGRGLLWSGFNPFDASLYPGNVTIDPWRLKRIAIEFNSDSFANAAYATQPLDLPELECLELSGSSLSSFSYPVHGRLTNLFERTPKLRTLHLSLQGESDTPFALPRDQIVNLHLANYSEYPSLPNVFPNVVTATLQRRRMAFYNTIDIPFCKLILHDSDMNPLLSAFGLFANSRRILKMPRLTSLELIFSEPLDPFLYTVGIGCKVPDLTHSPLTELILTTVTIDYTEIISLLHTVPQLERLSIVERMDTYLITPEFIQELGRPGPEILRDLRHLQLVWWGNVDESAVMDVLEERALKSAVIGIRMGGELSADTLSRVDALRKHGMQISVW